MCFYLLKWVVHPDFRIWKLRLVILIKLQRRRVYQHIFDSHVSCHQMLPITILYLPRSWFPYSISSQECHVRPSLTDYHRTPLLSCASQPNSLRPWCLSWFFVNILQMQRTNITRNSRNVHILSDDEHSNVQYKMCHLTNGKLLLTVNIKLCEWWIIIIDNQISILIRCMLCYC